MSVGVCGGEMGATGRGVAYLVNRAMELISLPADQATAAIQGFGNVGAQAALTLASSGTRILAVTDHTGGIHADAGLDILALQNHVLATGGVAGFPGADSITNEELFALPADVLIPAALEGQITGENAPRLRCRILAEGANGPTTADGDAALRDSDIFVLPDILCNAGGVVVSYFEWVQNMQGFSWTEGEVNDRLYRILEKAFQEVLAFARKHSLWTRDAALAIGVDRVRQAKLARGLFP